MPWLLLADMTIRRTNYGLLFNNWRHDVRYELSGLEFRIK